MADKKDDQKIDFWADLTACWGCCSDNTVKAYEGTKDYVTSDEFKQGSKDAYNYTKTKAQDGYNTAKDPDFQQKVKDGAITAWEGTKNVANNAYDLVTDKEFQQNAKDTAAVVVDVSKKAGTAGGKIVMDQVQDYKKTNNV